MGLANRIAATLIILVVLPVLGVAADAIRIDSYQLYYGGDQDVIDEIQSDLRSNQVVIIDVRALSDTQLEQLRSRAKRSKAKVVAYISIGEIHRLQLAEFKAFFGTVAGEKRFLKPDSIVIDRNDQFNSWRVDVRAIAWRQYLHKQADAYYDQGVDGLFLDTVDTVDHYINRDAWSMEQRVTAVEAMMALIREFKIKSPDKFVIQNRGLNLIGKDVFVGAEKGKLLPGLNFANPLHGNPDAVMYENAFASTDAWTKTKERQLRSIAKNGHTQVISLGYAVHLKSKDDFFSRSRDSGFVPGWATSSEVLHKERTAHDVSSSK